MNIEDPVVLARLPKPLQENYQHKYGYVHGLTAGQKRKRNEVSVAIDGNSVNIYEVEHGSIKASYAVPPAVSFVCSPSSIRVKTGKSTYSRYTYCATRRHGRQRLEFFEESFENDQSQGVASSNVTVAERAGHVAYLEILLKPGTGTASTEQHNLSALYNSGVVKLHSASLREEENTIQLVELKTAADVLAARWLTFEDVRNNTLKHRPDLLASADSTSTFLSVLYRQKSGLNFTAFVGIWSIPSARTDSRSSQITESRAITTYKLPDTQMWSQEMDLECSFNLKATSLLVTGVRGVANFDFSSYGPRITWEKQIPDHGLTSVRVNSSFMATSSTTALTIHDPKYNSLRATLDLTQIGKKRKRVGENATTRGFVRIVGYFRELDKLVTVRRNHLLSFEISGAPKETLLIDSIGYGVTEAHKAITTSELDIGIVDDLTGIPPKDWTILQQKLTLAAEVGDAAGFEETALKAVQNPDSLYRLSEQQIEFLLSKIFRWAINTTTDGRDEVQGRPYLQLALPTFTILSLLIESGAVVRHTIQQALGSVSHAGKIRHVEHGMIPAALIESDRTFALLQYFVDNAEFLDAKELAATVATLVNLVLKETYRSEPSDFPSQQLLDRSDLMVVDDESHTEETRNALAAQAALDTNNLEQISVTRILITTLEKFARFGAKVVAECIRSSLNRSETVTLIQILRQQLFEGQHTTSTAQEVYVSSPLSAHSSLEDRVSEPVLSLDATSKVLLGCIDGVGSLGFLVDGSGNDFLARVIPELRSETALATQGLEEASHLRGILRETLRYAQSADTDMFADSALPLTEDAVPTEQKPGTIITLFSEPTLEQGDIETKGGILPLSLHAENTITLTKMRKGGGQVKDRTLREVKDLENRNKGRYSFERLVL